MSKKGYMKVYERLEKAMLDDDCTYEEAKRAVDRLREHYFNRKASNFLKERSIKEIAGADP